jgi:hypothetical protein
MTTLNSALNFNVASEQAARIAYAERGAEESVAAQLRQAAAAEPFKVGATITARYQYKVAEDGSLIPLQTQITTDVREEKQGLANNSRRNGRSSARDSSEREPSLGDLRLPRAQISPSDEAVIFAVAGQTADTIMSDEQAATLNKTVAASTSSYAEVVDEDGFPVQAEILTPQNGRLDSGALNNAAQTKSSVAALYARNNDIVYSVAPVARLAA